MSATVFEYLETIVHTGSLEPVETGLFQYYDYKSRIDSAVEFLEYLESAFHLQKYDTAKYAPTAALPGSIAVSWTQLTQCGRSGPAGSCKWLSIT